jgi:hypothetical protein
VPGSHRTSWISLCWLYPVLFALLGFVSISAWPQFQNALGNILILYLDGGRKLRTVRGASEASRIDPTTMANHATAAAAP